MKTFIQVSFLLSAVLFSGSSVAQTAKARSAFQVIECIFKVDAKAQPGMNGVPYYAVWSKKNSDSHLAKIEVAQKGYDKYKDSTGVWNRITSSSYYTDLVYSKKRHQQAVEFELSRAKDETVAVCKQLEREGKLDHYGTQDCRGQVACLQIDANPVLFHGKHIQNMSGLDRHIHGENFNLYGQAILIDPTK